MVMLDNKLSVDSITTVVMTNWLLEAEPWEADSRSTSYKISCSL